VATLKDYPEIKKTIKIVIGAEEQEFGAYIEGSDSIKLDRYSTYKLVGTNEISQVEYVLEPTELASISAAENNTCVIHANNKNKLGQITLVATYNNKEYTKVIKIVPLW
jgi:hypothetical protein